MGKIIALANQKGGVAKTTSTYNLAAKKASDGKRVLMLDLDPQASLTIAAGIEPGSDELDGMSTCNLFDKKTDPLACCFSAEASGLQKLYIVPSDLQLAVTERDLTSGRNSDVQLRMATQKLRDRFDYIFIDCPPQLGTLLTNALTAADEVLVPVKTDYLAYRGLKALMDTIEGVKSGDGDRSLNPDLRFIGVIATLYKKSSNDHKEILALLEKNYKVFGVVSDTVVTNKGVVNGRPVVIAEPSSDVAKVYMQIADAI